MRYYLIKFLKMYLKKPTCWVLGVLYAALLIQVSWNDFSTLPTDLAGLYFFWIMPYLDASVTILLLLLTSLSSVHFLIEEWNNGYVLFYLNRTSLKKYVLNLVIRVILISSIVPLIGIFIYSMVILTKFPLINDVSSYLFVNSVETLVNGHLLMTNLYGLFYFLLLLNIVFSHVILIVFSVLVSVFINNKYIVYIFPTIIYTLLDVFFNIQSVPIILNPITVFGFYSYNAQYFELIFGLAKENVVTYLYPILYFIFLSFIAYWLIQRSLKGKIKSGISWGGGANANI